MGPTVRRCAVALALTLVAAGCGGERVEVPNVKGKRSEDAKAVIEQAGLHALSRRDENIDLPALDPDVGRITRQDPGAGSRVEKGTTVRIYFATGD